MSIPLFIIQVTLKSCANKVTEQIKVDDVSFSPVSIEYNLFQAYQQSLFILHSESPGVLIYKIESFKFYLRSHVSNKD